MRLLPEDGTSTKELRANGQCLACGSGDHQLTDCPIKGQRSTIPTLLAPGVKKNPAPAGRGTPLPPQCQLFDLAQRRTVAGHGRGHAFNLTAEQADALEEVVAGTILVQYFLVKSLFESGVSYCYTSTRFVKMHSIHYDAIYTQWEISIGNGIITTNREYKSCPVEVWGES